MQYIGFILAAISISIVMIINFRKIREVVLSYFSKDDIIFEKIHVTFDLESKSKINVYHTAKFKVKRNNPEIILGNFNAYGEIIDSIIKIDNVKLNRNDFQKDDELDIIKHKMFDKKISDTSIITIEDSYILDKENIDLDDDGLGEYLKYHRAKNLSIHIIFPVNFNPIDLNFTKSNGYEDSPDVKIMDKEPILIACFKDNRKQIFWEIDYPNFKKNYNINWKWK